MTTWKNCHTIRSKQQRSSHRVKMESLKKFWTKNIVNKLLISALGLILWPVTVVMGYFWVSSRFNDNLNRKVALIGYTIIIVFISAAWFGAVSGAITGGEVGWGSAHKNKEIVKETVAASPKIKPNSPTRPQPIDESQQKPVEPVNDPVALNLNVVDLIKEFDENQLAAEAKYKKKLIEFTAIVENISEDLFGTPFVSLKPGKDEYYYGTTIKCNFKNKSEVMPLKNGQSVVLQGTVNSQSLGIIILDECKTKES